MTSTAASLAALRRRELSLPAPAELAIDDATREVGKLPVGPRRGLALDFLALARSAVADAIDAGEAP